MSHSFLAVVDSEPTFNKALEVRWSGMMFEVLAPTRAFQRSVLRKPQACHASSLREKSGWAGIFAFPMPALQTPRPRGTVQVIYHVTIQNIQYTVLECAR